MVSTPELLVYVLVNAGFVAISGLLASLSFYAYRREPDQRSYAIATVGFGCIILAGLFESIYALVIEPDLVLTGSEFLYLQAAEDLVIALGLGLLFVAIINHDTDASRVEDDASLLAEDGAWISGSIHGNRADGTETGGSND